MGDSSSYSNGQIPSRSFSQFVSGSAALNAASASALNAASATAALTAASASDLNAATSYVLAHTANALLLESESDKYKNKGTSSKGNDEKVGIWFIIFLLMLPVGFVWLMMYFMI